MHVLDNESGGHQIQRIPPTEKKGRVHTSVVTVAVINSDIPRIDIKDTDFKIEWYSGTGAGGQHRNKHQNSCRITHLPTGKISTAQCRSRIDSLEKAKNSLVKIIEQENLNSYYDQESMVRKTQIGLGLRSGKIRTYRFQDDVVKDYITGKSANLKKILKGNLDLLW